MPPPFVPQWHRNQKSSHRYSRSPQNNYKVHLVAALELLLISCSPKGHSLSFKTVVLSVMLHTCVVSTSSVCLSVCRNVISTVKLGCFLDLDFIAGKAWNVEYKPKVQTFENFTQKKIWTLLNEIISNNFKGIAAIVHSALT